MDYSKEQTVALYKKLPEDLQKIVVSEGLGIEIQLLGRDLGITPEQSLDVEDEVIGVLMGVSHPKDFIRNIQSKIGVDSEKARAIAEKVNEEIFQPVKESLKIVHNIKDDQQPTINKPQPSQQTATPYTPRPTPNVPPTPSLPGSTLNVPRPPAPPTPPAPPKFPVAPKPPVPPTTSPSFPQMIVPPKINIEILPKPPTQNIFEQKLQGVFKMPKEETLVPQKPSSSPTPPTPPRPSGVDPYREPPK